MKIEYQHDRYEVHCGMLTRTQKEQCLEWCWASWGDGWGYMDTVHDETTFMFNKAYHAQWFVLKWSDLY